jgi:hypothetical protein
LFLYFISQNALDIPANDEADDFDTNKMGQAIKDKLEAIQKTYDAQFTALTEVLLHLLSGSVQLVDGVLYD